MFFSCLCPDTNGNGIPLGRLFRREAEDSSESESKKIDLFPKKNTTTPYSNERRCDAIQPFPKTFSHSRYKKQKTVNVCGLEFSRLHQRALDATRLGRGRQNNGEQFDTVPFKPWRWCRCTHTCTQRVKSKRFDASQTSYAIPSRPLHEHK